MTNHRFIVEAVEQHSGKTMTDLPEITFTFQREDSKIPYTLVYTTYRPVQLENQSYTEEELDNLFINR